MRCQVVVEVSLLLTVNMSEGRGEGGDGGGGHEEKPGPNKSRTSLGDPMSESKPARPAAIKKQDHEEDKGAVSGNRNQEDNRQTKRIIYFVFPDEKKRPIKSLLWSGYPPPS